MRWSIIVGNPPYNNRKMQIYPLFYLWAKDNCDYMSMIFPTGWQDTKIMNGLSLMNTADVKYDKQIVSIDNIINGFKNVTGAKKTNIIYWKKGYDNGLGGKQLVYTDSKNPQEIKFAISTKELEKIKEIEDFAKLIKDSEGFVSMKSDIHLKAYGIRTYFLDDKRTLPPMNDEKIEDGITVYGMINKSTRVKKYVDDNYPFPRTSKALNNYKVFIPSVWGGLNGTFIGGSYSAICIAKPKDACTESYVESGNFDNFNDAKKHAKYFMSKFLRALLVIDKTSIINSLKCYNYIPVQDYSEDFWNSDNIDDIDNGLFDKYNVPEELRKFVKEKIQPKTTADILGYDGKEIDKKEDFINISE
jgi:hypothetical protein